MGLEAERHPRQEVVRMALAATDREVSADRQDVGAEDTDADAEPAVQSLNCRSSIRGATDLASKKTDTRAAPTASGGTPPGTAHCWPRGTESSQTIAASLSCRHCDDVLAEAAQVARSCSCFARDGTGSVGAW